MSLKAFALRCEKPCGIEAIDKYKDVQLIDPAFIAGEEHLKSAIASGELAFKRGEAISTNPFIEVVVRAAQTNQIKTAFEILGPKGKIEIIAISKKRPTAFMDEYGCHEEPGVLLVDAKKYEKIKKKFKITESEILAVSSDDFKDRVQTLQKIIAERMALLNKV